MSFARMFGMASGGSEPAVLTPFSEDLLTVSAFDQRFGNASPPAPEPAAAANTAAPKAAQKTSLTTAISALSSEELAGVRSAVRQAISSRAECEKMNEVCRLGTRPCAPYPRAPWPWAVESGRPKIIGPGIPARSTKELLDIVERTANEYVRKLDLGIDPDEREVGLPWMNLCGPSGLGELMTSICRGEGELDIADVFSRHGSDAQKCTRISERRELAATRSTQADDILRAHTIYHNGSCPTREDGAEYIGSKIPVDAKTRFQTAARKFRLPTEGEVKAVMPKNPSPSSTHPMSAAERHLTVTKIRAVAQSVGAEQWDPNVSASGRDDLAYGDRTIQTLKDFSHVKKPRGDKPRVPGTKVVHTYIDCLNYYSSIAQSAGHDMIFWASWYPDLAGKTAEGTYYADSDTTYVEVIGNDDVVAEYRRQTPWDFTANDVVYVENVDRSSFTIYNRVRYVQPHLLKQVVFLCATHTINLPYAIANQLVRYSEGHDLGSIGISTPGPCKNVHLVPRDPARGWTQDILVMRNGNHFSPTVTMKYRTATGPGSSVHMDVDVYYFLKMMHNSAGRGMSNHEIVKRVNLWAEEHEKTNVPSTAALCELLRTAAWWGELPNAVYYSGNKRAVEDPENGALPGEGEVPEEHRNAKAVLSGPQLVDDTNPSVLSKSDGAMESYKDTKMIGMANKTKPSESWRKISNLILDGFIDNVARESCTAKGSVSLVDVEHIRAKRTRPAQRARQVTDSLGPGPVEIGRVENKIEAAHKTSECPRGVQNPSHDISELSAVLGKTLELVLKQCKFYDPGKTPLGTAEAVKECFDMSERHEREFEAGGLRSVDYTGADESHSEFTNRIVRAFIKYFIAPTDVAEALRIYDSCFNMPMQVGFEQLSTLWKNASGTGITTVLNTVVFAVRELETTIISLIMASMAEAGELGPEGDEKPFKGEPEITYRLFQTHLHRIQKTWNLHKTCAGFKPGTKLVDIAYQWIGPKFGDDGLAPGTPYVSRDLWGRAMRYTDRMDGYKRKLETTACWPDGWDIAGDPVEYLSRIFPCLDSAMSSFCKVEKAMAKLCVAVNRDRDKFIAKLRGYYTTDRNTPIVGAYLQALANLYGISLSTFTQSEIDDLYDKDREVYYKVCHGPYPWEEGISKEIAYEVVAADYGMTSGELMDFDDELRRKKTWMEIQGHMVPKKAGSVLADTIGKMVTQAEDPVASVRKPDPPGVHRVAAFDGGDPRMLDFEGEGKGFSEERTKAAVVALGLESREAGCMHVDERADSPRDKRTADQEVSPSEHATPLLASGRCSWADPGPPTAVGEEDEFSILWPEADAEPPPRKQSRVTHVDGSFVRF